MLVSTNVQSKNDESDDDDNVIVCKKKGLVSEDQFSKVMLMRNRMVIMTMKIR